MSWRRKEEEEREAVNFGLDVAAGSPRTNRIIGSSDEMAATSSPPYPLLKLKVHHSFTATNSEAVRQDDAPADVAVAWAVAEAG